jgi:hypothetical protein
MEILDRLQEIQNRDNDLIPKEVNVHEEYGLARSFRRGATPKLGTQAWLKMTLRLQAKGQDARPLLRHPPNGSNPTAIFSSPLEYRGRGGKIVLIYFYGNL